MIVSFINSALPWLVLMGQIIIVGLLLSFIIKNEKLNQWLGSKTLLFSFIVALMATSGSLFYSEIMGYDPCKLCWFQRIFMYPQVILWGLALIKKDQKIVDYGLTLSILGALIAAYHYLLQIGLAPSIDCGAVGYAAQCSQRFVMEFGYITIPLMALTAFVMIILFALNQKSSAKNR